MTPVEKALLIVQIVTTLIVAGTFVVYLLQLRAMRHASRPQNMLSVISYLQDPEVREARI